MDFEAPMDAWYVFLGVAMVSVSLFGVVLALPSTPAPAASEAADAIDELAASGYNASGSYDHDAEQYFVTRSRIGLKNDGGSRTTSFTFASPAPVWPDIDTQPLPEHREPGNSDEELKAILDGDPPSRHYRTPAEFGRAIEAAQDRAARSLEDDGIHKWRLAEQRLRFRHVQWGDQSVTLVGT